MAGFETREIGRGHIEKSLDAMLRGLNLGKGEPLDIF